MKKILFLAVAVIALITTGCENMQPTQVSSKDLKDKVTVSGYARYTVNNGKGEAQKPELLTDQELVLYYGMKDAEGKMAYIHYALSYTRTHIVEMLGIALNYTAEADYCITILVFDEINCAQRKFETAWNASKHNVVIAIAVFFQCFDCSACKVGCYFLVPLRYSYSNSVWILRILLCYSGFCVN